MARRRRWRLRAAAFVLLALVLAAAAAWFVLPLESWPTIAEVIAFAQRASASPLAPATAVLAFVVGGLVVFPINLSIAATIVVFGPFLGSVYALLGSVASAAVLHALGHHLPAERVARLLGARGERLRLRIVGLGFAAVALVRFLPVAPFSVTSFVAGAARIHRGGYIVGTALGMLPGIVLYALFVDRALAALADPHPLALLGVAAAIALIVAVALGVRAWQSRRNNRAP